MHSTINGYFPTSYFYEANKIGYKRGGQLNSTSTNYNKLSSSFLKKENNPSSYLQHQYNHHHTHHQHQQLYNHQHQTNVKPTMNSNQLILSKINTNSKNPPPPPPLTLKNKNTAIEKNLNNEIHPSLKNMKSDSFKKEFKKTNSLNNNQLLLPQFSNLNFNNNNGFKQHKNNANTSKNLPKQNSFNLSNVNNRNNNSNNHHHYNNTNERNSLTNSLYNNINTNNGNNIKLKSLNYSFDKLHMSNATTNYNPASLQTSQFQTLNLNNVFNYHNSLTNNSIMQQYIYQQTYANNSIETNDSLKVFRKLGFNERLFHGETIKNRNYIFRSVLLTSEIDLYKYLDIVNQAIHEWKSYQPLLRAKIVTKILNDNPNPFTNREYYFVQDTTSTNSNDNMSNKNNSFQSQHHNNYHHNNVVYYNYKSNNQTATVNDELWKLFVERESTIPLDENGLLWRLSFLKLKNSTKSDATHKFNYIIVATFEHSIMDGRSSYTSLLQLLAIIENLYAFNFTRPKELDVLAPKEEIFKNRREIYDPSARNKTYLSMPYFLLSNNFNRYLRQTQQQNKFKNITQTDIESGYFYPINSNKDESNINSSSKITVRELVETSKQVNSKFRTLLLKSDDLGKLLKICKENDVKLTSFLNVALVYAIRLMHDRFEIDFTKKSPPINYVTNVSLREFPEFKRVSPDTNQSLGCYVSILFNTFKEYIYFDEENQWINKFWRDAKQDSVSMHERLKVGEVFNPNRLPNKRIEANEFFYHFSNSNLGVMKSSLTDRKMIKIKQTFASGRFSRENTLCWFSNFLATIENELSWTISYNSAFIRPEVIDMIIENLVKILTTFLR